MIKGAYIAYRPKDPLKRQIFLAFVISFAFVFLFSSLGIAPEVEGQDNPKAFSKLLSKAQTTGSVRIIVKLDTSFRPEGQLSGPQAAISQQARIAMVQGQLLDAVSKYNAQGIKRYKYTPYTAMEVDSTALRALISDPLVISIQEDIPVPPTLTDSVPLVKADQAWTAGYTGSGWTVAILDSGVDKTHSFFSGGKVVAEACFSTTSVAGSSTTVCPNGKSSEIGSGAGVNCSAMITGCDHGTHVAGIAAGKAASINGVAKDANIIAVQVFSKITDTITVTDCTKNNLKSPCALTYTSDQDAALEHVYSLRSTYKIAAVNMSLGGGKYNSNCDSESSSTKAAIDNLRAAGIATVISSGNNGYCDGIGSPACISTAVSVGATTKSDAEASYSNYYSTLLTMFAPGSSIKSSIPGGGWDSWDGTSMAAPHVAGAWAILKQKAPSASVDSILNRLKNSGVAVKSRCSGGGQKPRINVLAALSASDSPPKPPSGLSASASSARSITLKWADNSSDETGFKIERKTGSSGTYSEIATVDAGVTTYNDTGLTEGTTYYYEVRAYNGAGDSAYSNEESTTTLPAAPSSLSTSASSTSQIDLSWTDNSAGETGFKIERKTEAGGTYTEIATVAAETTKYSNSGLTAATTYYYRVMSYSAAGNSDYSNEATSQTPSPPTSGGSSGGGGGCFIATAAYGSYLAPEVEVLRQFRDDYLITNPIGQTFVELYYNVSPPAAKFISRSEGLKSLTRCALTPVVYGLKYPFVFLIFMSFVLVVILGCSARKIRL